MGTRAVFEFVDDYGTSRVYKHWDGYPAGACRFIRDALHFAWPLPRFEASDFAAAFVAANKPKGGGDVDILHPEGSIGAIRYWYRVSRFGDEFMDGPVKVEAFRTVDDAPSDPPFWVGTLANIADLASAEPAP